MQVLYCKDLNCIMTGLNSYIAKYVMCESKHLWKINELGQQLQCCQYAIHLAAKPQCDTLQILKQNILCDLELFEFAEQYHLKIIYASGNNVYQFAANCTTDMPAMFRDNYSLTKFIGEAVLSLNKLDFCIVRIGDVFGKGQRHGNFFKALESAIKNNTQAELFGNGGKVRNYIYIKDLARLLLFLLQDKSAKIVNACYKESVSIHFILNYLLDKKFISGIKLCGDQYESKSFLDYRTMIPTEFSDFHYEFNMLTALDDFVKECRNV